MVRRGYLSVVCNCTIHVLLSCYYQNRVHLKNNTRYCFYSMWLSVGFFMLLITLVVDVRLCFLKTVCVSRAGVLVLNYIHTKELYVPSSSKPVFTSSFQFVVWLAPNIHLTVFFFSLELLMFFFKFFWSVPEMWDFLGVKLQHGYENSQSV